MSKLDLRLPESSSTSVPCSVIICTRRRERLADLQSTLHALRNQSVRPHEIVFVIDHDPELFILMEQEALSNLAENVQLIRNRHSPGISGARNSGLEAATGDIVMFLDDDASPHSRWVEHLFASYADKSVMAAGGRAVPSWHLDKPTWFPDQFGWVIGCSSEDGQSFYREVTTLVGCNMSYRRSILNESTRFEQCSDWTEDNGREREFCQALLVDNPTMKIVFVPKAEVRHRVHRARSTLVYFLRRCFVEGVGRASSKIVSRRAVIAEAGRTFAKLMKATYRFLIGENRSVRGLLAILIGAALTSAGFCVGLVVSCPTLSPLLASHRT